MTDSDTDTDASPLIAEMAQLLAKQKLVPFFGAGISRHHLGFAAAELADQFALAIDVSPATLLSEVSDVYADQLGERAFVDFLEDRLVVTNLDDSKATSHRLLVSLIPNLIYTTNQDNLFELTAKKYGRNYRPIITITDLSDSVPGEPLLIKFHGDPSVPESLVFGARSYQQRMASIDHPLDVKLRADLLGKRLLFVGYSLRDENIAKILDTVQRAFGGTLPPSYLIAFDDDPELIATAIRYQVQVVVPWRLFPDSVSNLQAFERCLTALCNATRKRQVALGVEDILSYRGVNPRVATDFDVNAVASIISVAPFEEALDAFRGTFDQTRVPDYLQERVTNLFLALVERCDPSSSPRMGAVKAALFNFRLPPASALLATASVMAACNRRPKQSELDGFSTLTCPALPGGSTPVAAATAVAMLGARSETVTDNFRTLARWWFSGWNEVPEVARDSVKQMIEAAWPGDRAAESPINNPIRTLGIPMNFHEIFERLSANLPKRVSNPKE